MQFLRKTKAATISFRVALPLPGTPMKFLLFLANGFINTFGITQPSEAAAKRSAQFIAFLIGLVLVIFFCVAGIGIYILTRH
jgi:heme/copper-type cytochrome/quinol oxidase subunit 2